MLANLRDEGFGYNKNLTLPVSSRKQISSQLHPSRPAKILRRLCPLKGSGMTEPKASRPYWPDALQNPSDDTTGLKPWQWALERLEKSHNYWIATSRPEGRPHLMLVWGIWWEAAFWFSTGPRTRKAKNIAVHPECTVGTEDASEAVILEGSVEQISDRAVWKRLCEVYDKKYGGHVLPLLESSGGNVYRVAPRVFFGQDEHAENFTEALTRWTL